MLAVAPDPGTEPDGITAVALRDLLAIRAQAGKPLHARAPVPSTLAGFNVSSLRGRGMDYAESRVYQPGDDVRNIDWRRSARSGKWHTKLFESERERAALLLLDTHASMHFGTRVRFKSVAAARAAAWLAWIAVRSGDRVGAMAFGAVGAAVPPRAGTHGALAVLGAIARWDVTARGSCRPDEPLSVALARAQRLAVPGRRAWLLSDGWCCDGDALAALARLARRVALRVVIIADALEREVPATGDCVFEARGTRRRVALSRAGPRALFRERMARGSARLAEACAAAGVACTILPASDEPWRVLDPRARRERTPR